MNTTIAWNATQLLDLRELQRKLGNQSASSAIRFAVSYCNQNFLNTPTEISVKSFPLPSPPSPSEVSEALRMHKGHPWLPPGCSMSDRIMRCWDRLSADQRDCYRSMCGWSEEDATAALEFAKQTY